MRFIRVEGNISRLQSVVNEHGRGDVTNGCRPRHHCSCTQAKASSYQDCACVVVSNRVPMTGVLAKHFTLVDYFPCGGDGALVPKLATGASPADRRTISHAGKESPVS